MDEGLSIAAGGFAFAKNFGIRLPVKRGLVRAYLLGSSAFGDTDLAGSGIAGNMAFPDAPYAFTVRQPWCIDLTLAQNGSQQGGYDPHIPLAAPPVPPATLIAVARNGVSLGNSDDNAPSTSISMNCVNGALQCQAAVGFNAPGAPSIQLPPAYLTEFNFYAATYDYVAGGQETQKLYYGRQNTLQSASGSQAAAAQTTLPSIPLHSFDRDHHVQDTAKPRGLAVVLIYNVKLTDAEIGANYQFTRRFCDGRLPDNGL